MFLLIIVLVLLIIYGISIYNRLIKLDNLAQEGWSGIDVQLKRRTDLVPNLVACVQGYMGHERGVLEDVTKLRVQCVAATTLQDRAHNENMLTIALRQLFAVSEHYPDLKAIQKFMDLQHSLSAIEEQIQLARRYYNGTVRDFNIVVQSFPSNAIARHFRFTKKEFFEIAEPAERAAPAVKFS